MGQAVEERSGQALFVIVSPITDVLLDDAVGVQVRLIAHAPILSTVVPSQSDRKVSRHEAHVE